MPGAIYAEGLVKTFGDVRALDGVDFDVPEGTVLGLLGPNGAGKTTAVRCLTTLLRPDRGKAIVAGIDVLKNPNEVRRSIGLSGQFAAVDEYLTGRENLQMVGQLYQMKAKDAKVRAGELLEQFNLADAADRPAKTYSGGMRRRLDLAAARVARPPLLFLVEPTPGLDLRSRLGLWEAIEKLVAEGTTVVLTTQYLDEADRLAERIAVIDQGRVIAEGTPRELKEQIGGDRLEVQLCPGADGEAAVRALAGVADGRPELVDGLVRVPLRERSGAITAAVRRLDEAGVRIDDIALREPTLDDVFLQLTGHHVEQDDEPAER